MNPELSVPGHGLFFSYSFDVIRHVSRHRRDVLVLASAKINCLNLTRRPWFQFFQGVMDGALVLLTSLRI